MQHPDLRGLAQEDTVRQLEADGPNALSGSEPKSLLRITADVVAEPMFLMLLAAGMVYLAIGDAAEATFLLGSVFAVIGLTRPDHRGHNVGVVNPPLARTETASKVRHPISYRIGIRAVDGKYVDPDAWLASAQRHEGPW